MGSTQILAPAAITDEELRAAGFTMSAREFSRDEIALRLLCAFNGVDPHRAPPAWWFHPCAGSQDAWRRVADEAMTIYAAHAALASG